MIRRNKTEFLLVVLTLGLTSGTLSAGESKKAGIPLPRIPVRVLTSAPRVELFNALTEKEKKLAFHLVEAARAGRTIVFYQGHRHALVLREVIENALSAKNVADTKALLGEKAFTEFVKYSAKFEDLHGPYETSNLKYVLKEVTPQQAEQLIRIYAAPGVEAKTVKELTALLTDPIYEALRAPEDPSGAGLELCGGNLYEKGITGEEVRAALSAGLQPKLNGRIVRNPKGGLKCQVQALNNPEIDPAVRSAFEKIVRELRLALPYALTDHQHAQLEHLIKYLEEGDVKDFREFNIEWVKDGSNSPVDFMMGYVETPDDYLGQIATWESYVQIVDPKTTEISKALARNAQRFEDAMPYGQWKKTFPKNYSPPALMVYYFQELGNFHSGGYNLLNFDDIRRDVGAKNIIRLELPGADQDPEYMAIRKEYLVEFLASAKVQRTLKHLNKQRRVLVLHNENMRHGSGIYDETKYPKEADPVAVLGSLGGALEEQRADLTAMTFVNSPILVEVGLYANQSEADEIRNAMYDAYMADFLRVVSMQRSFREMHTRGHWLFINYLLKNGVVTFKNRDGSSDWTPENVVLDVTDYQKVQDLEPSRF